jgi:ATP-dependent DNA ligase
LLDWPAPITQTGMLTLINPVERAKPFDHADWLSEPKFDGFRAAADTVRGRLISPNGNRWTSRLA